MNGMEWVLESSWKSVSFVPYDMYFRSKNSAFGEQLSRQIQIHYGYRRKWSTVWCIWDFSEHKLGNLLTEVKLVDWSKIKF